MYDGYLGLVALMVNILHSIDSIVIYPPRRDVWIKPTETETDEAAYADWQARYERSKGWWK